VTDWATEIRNGALAGGAFLAIVGVAELWARKGGSPERTRKLVHVAGGVLALAFPHILRSVWTVLGLALLSSALLDLGRRHAFLRCVHSVGRRTRGAEYYPFAIAIVFFLAARTPWLYTASILVLAVADGCAALVGIRWGRMRYEVEDETKSVEGSLAFLAVAFAAIAVPMSWGTAFTPAAVVAAAALVALLVTLVEAVSLDGGDNLLVPLTTTLVLIAATDERRTPAENASAAATLLGMLAALGLIVRRTRAFNVGATLVIVLFSFAAWGLGGWNWALPVVAGFVPYMLLRHAISGSEDYVRQAKVRVLSRVLLPPFVLVLLAGRVLAEKALYGPYLAACTSILTLSAWRFLRWRYGPTSWRRPAGALATALVAWAIIVAMPGLELGAGLAEQALPCATAVVAALVADRLLGAVAAFDPAHLWPRSQWVLASASAVVVYAAQRAGWVPDWAGVVR
jgi:phytol kinase